MSPRLAPTALALALVLGGTAACSDDGGGGGSVSTTTTTEVASSTGDASSGGSTSTEKVSANDASVDEIAAALEAAGVPNADRWADEVVEYRPYDDAAEGFPRLQEELAKYNPPEGTVDQIIAVLQ